jgi:hypothetical protein
VEPVALSRVFGHTSRTAAQKPSAPSPRRRRAGACPGASGRGAPSSNFRRSPPGPSGGRSRALTGIVPEPTVTFRVWPLPLRMTWGVSLGVAYLRFRPSRSQPRPPRALIRLSSTNRQLRGSATTAPAAARALSWSRRDDVPVSTHVSYHDIRLIKMAQRHTQLALPSPRTLGWPPPWRWAQASAGSPAGRPAPHAATAPRRAPVHVTLRAVARSAAFARRRIFPAVRGALARSLAQRLSRRRVQRPERPRPPDLVEARRPSRLVLRRTRTRHPRGEGGSTASSAATWRCLG